MINYWKMITNRSKRTSYNEVNTEETNNNVTNVQEKSLQEELTGQVEEQLNISSSSFHHNHSLPSISDIAAEHITEYMTCAICFQFVTDNRECLRCHRVSCSNCVSQFHSSKDKAQFKPCPACNTPTVDENGKEISFENSLLEIASHLQIRSINDRDGENELIDTFLNSLNSSMFSTCTKLVHNKLLQKMVDEMPSSCPHCRIELLHGNLPDHYPLCQAAVTYGEYYRLGKAFDIQYEELLQIERENTALREESLNYRSTIFDLEKHIVELRMKTQEREKELLEVQRTTKELFHRNQQLEKTIQDILRDSK